MTNHHGDTQVQVFVSHKTEDKRLAEKIRDKLMILSIGKIRPNLCYEIPGGEQYQEVIEESLRTSNILIFLYTSKEADLKWCLYEAGVFIGSNISQKKHLVCIKASAIEEPPVAMKNLQAYSADKEGIENFLKDLLCKGTFTNGEIINQRLLTDFKAEYERAIEEIEREFSSSVISTEYFCTRASIEIPKAPNDKEQIAIDQAIITGNESTMKILGVKNGSLLSNLYELYSKSKNAKWVEEIKECVQNICRQATPTRPLTQFRSISNDNYYTPLVSRVERIQNNPVRICVIFINTSQIIKEAETAKIPFKMMPPDHKAVTQLISMALTLRWEIIEPYVDRFDLADEQGLKDFCTGLNETLSEFEMAGEDFSTISLITTFFPVADHPIIRKAIKKYVDARNEIAKAIDSPNRDEIIKAINDIRWSNKVLLKKATEVCYKNIDELEPINMNEN